MSTGTDPCHSNIVIAILNQRRLVNTRIRNQAQKNTDKDEVITIKRDKTSPIRLDNKKVML